MDQERKAEILQALYDERAFGVVEIDPESEGVIVYERGASRVGGEPAIEIPLPDGCDRARFHPREKPTGTTFDKLLSQYGCRVEYVDGMAYVVVDEDACSKRPPASDGENA